MQRAVRLSLKHPQTHELARALLVEAAGDSPPGPPSRETMHRYCALLHRWLRSVVWYQEVPEVVGTVPQLIRHPAGDCDDTTAAALALTTAVGLQPTFREAHRGSLRHVWCEVPSLGLALDSQVTWSDARGADPRETLIERGWD